MKEKKVSLSEILLNLSEDDLYEVGCKFKFDPTNLSPQELAQNLSIHILKNISKVFELYSKNEINFLKDIINSDDSEIEADIDYNIFICDGLLDVIRKEENDVFYITNDFATSLKAELNKESTNEIIDKYDRFEKIVIGIIRTYGIIDIENVFNVYFKLNEIEINYDDFEHLIFHRSSILKDLNIYNYETEEYIMIDEIDEPDEMINMISTSSYNYNILISEQYIKNAEEEYICDNDKLDTLKRTLKIYLVNDEYHYNDLVDTLIYDIKSDNYNDLMLDITTYISLATKEEEDEIKKELDDLYNNTLKWAKKGNL